MKGYILKYNKPLYANYSNGMKQHIANIGFDWKVFRTLRGIKSSLRSHWYVTKRFREKNIEIWEVEITPVKKVI